MDDKNSFNISIAIEELDPLIGRKCPIFSIISFLSRTNKKSLICSILQISEAFLKLFSNKVFLNCTYSFFMLSSSVIYLIHSSFSKQLMTVSISKCCKQLKIL